MEAPADDVPMHLKAMHPPFEALKLFAETKTAMDFLFSHLLNVNSKWAALAGHPKEKYIGYFKENGMVAFPTNPTSDFEVEGRIAAPSVLRQILQSDPRLRVIDQLWSIYEDKIVQHLAGTEKVEPRVRARIKKHIDEKGELELLKYAPGTGLWLHMDNLLRCDASIFAVGIGRDVVYDMARVIERKPGKGPSIVRTSNPEGTMIVLDGESRYKWAHGVPTYQKSYGRREVEKKLPKYSFLLRLYHHEDLSREVGFCKEIGAKMYTMLD